jgi:hypothetical protein
VTLQKSAKPPSTTQASLFDVEGGLRRGDHPDDPTLDDAAALAIV